MATSIPLSKNKRRITVCGVCTAAVILGFFLCTHVLPYAALTRFLNQEYSSVFIAADDAVLQVRAVDDGVRRQFTPLDELPDQLVQAFLTAEDSRFYWHYGVDLLAVARAAAQNVIFRRNISGASTITMQLVRIIEPAANRSFSSKLSECGKAFLLEGRLTKKEILELYLNTVPFGNNVEGVTSAAWYFFGKKPDTLSSEEILCLAVIPRRPGSYNPIQHPDATAAAAWSLHTFDKSVTWEGLLAAARSASVHGWPFQAPHAVMRAASESAPDRDTRYPVRMTIDSQLQQLVQYEMQRNLERNAGHRIENGACMVIENGTGRILAYMGSNDWFDEEHGGQIDGMTVPQQMGSSMKPFLYAAALEDGLVQPADILADIPSEFGSENLYFPLNFNNRYNGPVLLRKALASSLNIPAVTMLSQLGVNRYLTYLSNLGFASLEDGSGSRADLGLSLGAGEVTLEELTRAFAVFSCDGELPELTLIDDGDKGDKDSRDENTRVYSTDTARILADMLSDASARSGGFGQVQTFQTRYPSIFKTGTANQYQNIVAVGSTPRYTVGVWMGNFSGNTVMGKTGSSLPALIARTILDYLTERDEEDGLAPAAFLQPEGYTKVRVCSVSGKRPSEYCLHTVTEYCRNDLLDDEDTCTWHVRGADKSVKLVLSALYEPWLLSSGNVAGIDYSSEPLTITTPADGSVFWKGSGGTGEQIPVAVIGGGSGGEDDLLQVIYDSRSFTVSRPFTFTLPVERGIHRLSVCLDGQIQTIQFTVK